MGDFLKKKIEASDNRLIAWTKLQLKQVVSNGLCWQLTNQRLTKTRHQARTCAMTLVSGAAETVSQTKAMSMSEWFELLST